MIANITLIAVLVFVIAGIALFFVFRRLKKIRLKQALDLKLLSVRLPKRTAKDEGPQKDFKDEINLSAQLFSVLSGLNAPFSLEVAVHHIGEDINFYIGVAEKYLESVSRQIEGLFKDAQIDPIDDYNVFSSVGDNEGVFVKQKISFALPLRTYQEANVDTFLPILSGLSKINEAGEGAAIQILAKPAPTSVKKNILFMISRLKQGARLDQVIKGFTIDIKDLKKAAGIKDPYANPAPNSANPYEPKIIDQEAIKVMEAKISKPLFAVNLRVAASSPSKYQTDAILDGLTHGVSQFSAPMRQELQIVKPRNLDNFFYQFSFREFDESQSMMMNAEELASLYHLPTSFTDVPRINWVRSKEAAPPSQLPQSGTMIGESNFRNEHRPIYITEEDRRRHVYIIGQTGTGKTNLMMNMAIDDIRQGKGVCIVDPHGEDAEAVLSVIPKERLKDVVVFDPSDLARPVGMNMLEYDFNKPEEKTFIVNELFSILDKLYDMKTAGGPMFEQYTKNAILLLMEDMRNEPATLMEIARVFTDDAYRERKLSRITNPVVIDFWEKEATKASGEHSLANMSAYITSKFNNFTANDYMRPIIGQSHSAFNFRKIMDEKKILLLLLSKGKIGEANANLLGMIIIGKILMAALSRADIAQENRADFNLYIDEFQNFTTDATSVILSEARKYRLNLTVGHQFIAQLPEKIRDSIFGNVGNKIVFRVGTQDAEFLVKDFEPVFGINDLANIANGHAYAKILVNGQTTKPFNIHTFLKPKGDMTIISQVKELSRTTYGRDRNEVEQEIFSRLRN